MPGKVLTCPQCGASLKWQGVAAVVECRYCHAHVVTESGQRTELQAQATARKPVSALPFVLMGCLFVVGLVSMIGFGVAKQGGASLVEAPAMSMSEVAKLDLEVSKSDMERTIGKPPTNDHFYAPVDDDIIASISIGYTKELPDQASYIGLMRDDKDPLPESIVRRLSDQLGPKMERKDGGVSYNAPGVHIGSSGGGLIVSLHQPEREDSKKAFLIGWKAVLYAVRGKGKIDEDDARDHLARGYPMKSMRKLDGGMTFDNAPKLLAKQFPAVTQNGAGLKIPIEPGVFHELRLDFENAPGGRLVGLYLHIFPRSGATAKTLAKCLDKQLGNGEETVTDYANRESTWNWKGGGQPNVHLQGMGMSARFDQGADPRQLGKWMSKVEKCSEMD